MTSAQAEREKRKKQYKKNIKFAKEYAPKNDGSLADNFAKGVINFFKGTGDIYD